MNIKDPTIYPTGECFTDALDFISEVLTENPEDRDALVEELVLVHGIILDSADGHPIAHAWVEDTRTGRCIFKGILDGEAQYFGASQEEYYADCQVQETTRYTLREVWEHNQRTGHYGPWKPEYLALCGQGETHG
jgi:hypothetical protein